MRQLLMSLFICCSSIPNIVAQQQPTPVSDPIIEGGKLVVEILKVFGGRDKIGKENSEILNCKNGYANVCVNNYSNNTMVVTLTKIDSGSKRDLVIQPTGNECILNIVTGVWSFDVKIVNTMAIIRKGDVLIESCNDLNIVIK